MILMKFASPRPDDYELLDDRWHIALTPGSCVGGNRGYMLLHAYAMFFSLNVKRIGPISPTPVSPTLDQKVVFRLLIKNCIFGHQSDVKLHLEVD